MQVDLHQFTWSYRPQTKLTEKRMDMMASMMQMMAAEPVADSEDANEPPSLSDERTRVQFLVTDSNRRPQIDKIETWICWFSMGND
jgi:hypothetical protein